MFFLNLTMKICFVCPISWYLVRPFQDDAFNVVFQQCVHLKKKSKLQLSVKLYFFDFNFYLLAVTLTNSLFLVNNFSRTLFFCVNILIIMVNNDNGNNNGHLRERKKSATLDVTSDLVNCRCQLMHLGKGGHWSYEEQGISPSYTPISSHDHPS